MCPKTDDWQPHVVVDGNLITGQNPASSEAGAKALLSRLAGVSGEGIKTAGAAPQEELEQPARA